MRKLVLDSGILTDYIHRRRGVYERTRDLSRNGCRVGTSIPILAEMYFGIELSRSREWNYQKLRAALPTLNIWPFEQLDMDS